MSDDNRGEDYQEQARANQASQYTGRCLAGLKVLEAKMAQENLILTEEQVRALEKTKAERNLIEK